MCLRDKNSNRSQQRTMNPYTTRASLVEKTGMKIRIRILWIGVICLLAGCTGETQAPATVPPAQATATARTELDTEGYSLIKKTNLLITFYYPSTWKFLPEGWEKQTYGGISLRDPSKPDPVRKHYDPNLGEWVVEFPIHPDKNVGVIAINWSIVDPTTFSLDEKVELVKKDFTSPDVLFESRTLEIDTYTARWIVRKNDSSIREDVFLVIQDHLYHFTIQTPIAERQGDFGKGFDYLINSIRVVTKP